MIAQNLIGEIFGELEVIGEGGRRNTKDRKRTWLCKCRLCGSTRWFTKQELMSRKWPDCGCASRKPAKPKHKSGNMKIDTLCWECSLAGKSICEWDRELKPVPGWVAEETKLREPRGRWYCKSYRVISCPKKK